MIGSHWQRRRIAWRLWLDPSIIPETCCRNRDRRHADRTAWSRSRSPSRWKSSSIGRVLGPR